MTEVRYPHDKATFLDFLVAPVKLNQAEIKSVYYDNATLERMEAAAAI